MSAVAVGSVGHILKQTFKTLYPEFHSKDDAEDGDGDGSADAAAAGAGAGAGAGSGANGSVAGSQADGEDGDDAEAAGEGDGSDDAAGEGDAAADAGDGKEDAEGEGEGGGEEGEDGEGAAAKAQQEPEPEPEPLTEEERLEAEIAAEAERRAQQQIKDIRSSLTSRVGKSRQLQTFLERRQAEAKVKDVEDAENLRSWGLVQNSEMPMGASKLKIEPKTLQEVTRTKASAGHVHSHPPPADC